MFSRRLPLLKIAAVLALVFMSTVLALWFYDGEPASNTVSAEEPADTVVFACVNKSSGEIKIVDSEDTCKKNEDQISWPLDVGGVVQASEGFIAGTQTTGYTDGFITVGTEGLDINAGTIFITSTKRVGIGTTTPSASAVFEVNGSSQAGTLFNGGDVTVNGNSGSQTFIIKGSSGNVGIGVASPFNKLEVSGTTKLNNLKVTGTGGLDVASTSSLDVDGSTSLTGLFVSGVTNMSDDLKVDGSVFPSLFVDESANRVGLTTSNPQKTLDVNGDAIFRTLVGIGVSTLSSQVVFQVHGNTKLESRLDVLGLTTLADVAINSDLAVDTNTLFVDSTLNRVGIGNTTPKIALDLSGDMILGAKTERVTNGDFSTHTAPLDSPPLECDGWTLGAGWDCNPLANRVRAFSNPSGTLYQDTSEAAGDVYAVTYTLGGNTRAGSVTVSIGGVSGTSRAANGTYTELLTAISGGDLTFTPSADFDGFIDDVSVERYTGGDLLASGKVGIGTANPSASLDVVGNIVVSGTVDGVDILAHKNDANAHHTPGAGGAGSGWTDTGSQVRLTTASANVGLGAPGAILGGRLIIATTSTGKGVGIDTHFPFGALDVRGFTRLGKGTADSWFPYVDGRTYISGKGIILRSDNAGGYAERMRIADNGNVGIGAFSTANQPQQNLHIKDVMRLEPRASAPGSASMGDIYVYSTTATGPGALCFYDGVAWSKAAGSGSCP